MTCNHQWHDATSSTGPEWICAKCKALYSKIKDEPKTVKREWVELTEEDYVLINQLCKKPLEAAEYAAHLLKGKNT